MTTAKIICDSINSQGNRITTFEVEVPRIVWAEVMTHRQFSRNAASSRAIPFDRMMEQLDGVPTRFGAAQKGMQDNGQEFAARVELSVLEEFEEPSDSGLYQVVKADVSPVQAWEEAKDSAVKFSKAFKDAGFHKQIYNRLTEPFQMIKAVITATEFSNFFWLRDDVMADPTLADLARKMKVEYDASIPELLKAGELHLPYVLSCYHEDEGQKFIVDDEQGTGFFVTTEQAIKVSAARCAAVSYRNEDYTLEKCLQLYDRLVGDERKHSSALEHQATPMNDYLWGGLTKEERNETNMGNIVYWKHSSEHIYMNIPSKPHTWQEGVSHTDKQENLWSGNFKGWIQHRKTIEGECYNDIH